jgi:hypothetical protein
MDAFGRIAVLAPPPGDFGQPHATHHYEQILAPGTRHGFNVASLRERLRKLDATQASVVALSRYMVLQASGRDAAGAHTQACLRI